MEIISEYQTVYTKRTKHRARCPVCGKLIFDGENVVVRKIKQEKYYPVKGIMRFIKYKFYHSGCNGVKI